MFSHQVNFPTNFNSHGASYPEKLAISFVSFIIDHPVFIDLFGLTIQTEQGEKVSSDLASL
jgi:hypothetical protein